MAKKTKKTDRLPRTDTPVYDQLVAETGFAPHRPPPTGATGVPGLWEDNFS